MAADLTSSPKASFIRKHPALTYFLLTFAISWAAAFLIAAPKLLRSAPLPQLTGILMFPAMLVGPSVAGIFLTRWLGGHEGLKSLFAPRLVLAVLLYLKSFVSPVYTPNRFLIGVTFGILAGLLEEIGWMGFAYPKLRQQFTFLPAATILGLLWGLWHAPVIDFLGAASPHAGALPAFFAAFVAAMAAIRVLMAWLYEHTQSVALIHMSSTGSLVVFSPPAVSPLQEALWHALYAAALWLLVLLAGTRIPASYSTE